MFNYGGKYALVSGASSGIGAEFAKALAARGANLILVARRGDRLDALAAEIQTAHNVATMVITADLANKDAGRNMLADLDRRGIHVDVLINNAGWGYIGKFVEESADGMASEIALNVTSLVDFTRAFLPAMLERKSGVIVNVASTAAYQPLPGMAVYAATKAFVLSFTEAIWGETVGTGVKVLALSPGGTSTEFFEIAGGNSGLGQMQTAQQVVKTAMVALDLKNSPPSVISGRVNHLTSLFSRLLSRKAVVKITKQAMVAR